MNDKLPMLGIGKTWAIQLYPDGRRFMKQIEPSQIERTKHAIMVLQSGQMVHVWPSDADFIWGQYRDGA